MKRQDDALSAKSVSSTLQPDNLDQLANTQGQVEHDKQKRTVHVVLAGGGTAGHVNPLLAVAAALENRYPNVEITVVGTRQGLEYELVPQAGYPLDIIEKLPLPRRLNKDALLFAARWNAQMRAMREILRQRHADVVVGFGGYVAAPAYRQARHLHIPIVIHEQNARAGLANRFGARWASMIGTVYENTGLRTYHKSQRIERVGLPLRPEIMNLVEQIIRDPYQARCQGARQLGLDPDRPIVLVTGGSLGALRINNTVSQAAQALLAHAQIIHLTGKGKDDAVRRTVALKALDQLNDIKAEHVGCGDYHVADYLERIDWAFACADLVICRSGAGSVAEISALGLPAVYVPLPIGNGEQRFNAQPVVDACGALLVDDADFTVEWLIREVLPLLADRDRLQQMRQQSWNYGIRNAASIMAERIMEVVSQTSQSEDSRR